MDNGRIAKIRIGGTLTEGEALDAFLLALRDEGASTQWGGERFAPDSWDDVEAELADDGTLLLCGAETRWGELETLEAVCLDLQLVFVRRSEATRELNAECAFSRGDGVVGHMTTGVNGRPIITARALRGVLKDADADPGAAIARVRALLPANPPKVPPLELRSTPFGTGDEGTHRDVQHYLLVLHGGLEPRLRGPFVGEQSPEEGIRRELRRNSQLLAEDGRDTVCRLTVTTPPGVTADVEVGTYSGRYMDELRDEVCESQAP